MMMAADVQLCLNMAAEGWVDNVVFELKFQHIFPLSKDVISELSPIAHPQRSLWFMSPVISGHREPCDDLLHM